jgi:hypothetical protein
MMFHNRDTQEATYKSLIKDFQLRLGIPMKNTDFKARYELAYLRNKAALFKTASFSGFNY